MARRRRACGRAGSHLQHHAGRVLEASFTRTRNVTACSPSTRRWSYESATYIIGRITTWPSRATGRSSILCMPRMPDCGGLRIGVESSEPKTPPLVIVKVPPARSPGVSLPSRARRATSPMACSSAARPRPSAPRTTGTTSPRGVLTAMPRCTWRGFTTSVPSIRALRIGTSRSAWITARAKSDMRPRSTPCLALNRSRCRARSASSSPRSTSLKVVRMAAVRCASTRRAAMVRRSWLSGSRSASSSCAAGRRPSPSRGPCAGGGGSARRGGSGRGEGSGRGVGSARGDGAGAAAFVAPTGSATCLLGAASFGSDAAAFFSGAASLRAGAASSVMRPTTVPG